MASASHSRSSPAPRNLKLKLPIKILYVDDDIIIVNKPSNLRSVPGHANPPPDDTTTTTTTTNNISNNTNLPRQTAQETWSLAIRSFSPPSFSSSSSSSSLSQQHSPPSSPQQPPSPLLQNLATLRNPSSVPRKFHLFTKFCQRRCHNKCDNEDIEKAYKAIKSRQQTFTIGRGPEGTKDEDSAVGQLKLLGYETDPVTKPLRIVHRLDCETSGVMVVARTLSSASTLCRIWRARSSFNKNNNDGGGGGGGGGNNDDNKEVTTDDVSVVKKIYMAIVKRWPPYHDQNLTEGIIDLPLRPTKNERLTWEVASETPTSSPPLATTGGPSTATDAASPSISKPSQTSWEVVMKENEQEEKKRGKNNEGVMLLLQPLTGRTHQLRVHCAAVGSGIVGDSLYGEDRVEMLGAGGEVLRLHAWKLEFPHPRTGERVVFMAEREW